jgi:hypothetical protein
MRFHRCSLPVAGLTVGIAAVAMVVFQPSAALAAAGTPPRGQTGTAGRTAAQVSSRLVIDNLSGPGMPPGGQPASGNHAATGSYTTIALTSLHLRAPVARATITTVSTKPALTPASVPVAAAPTPVPAAPVVPAPTPVPAAPLAPPAPVPAAPVVPSAGVWAELRQCESGDNYTIDTGNGYYGAYQFSEETWQGLGYPGFPNQATPAVQDQAAQQLEARSGWGQWPECSVKLGL